MINANAGLGESVVAGMVSPDAFTVDKAARTILDRKVGAKETAVWLGEDGGTYQAPVEDRSEFCLSDAEVLDVTAMAVEVEQYYRKPVDIEWAMAGGALYLLQVRPITAYFPLPERMRTEPGEPKLLYGDLTLVKWGMDRPLSVVGTDYLQIANTAALRMTMGDVDQAVIDQLRLTVDGRTYINVSYSMKMQGKAKAAGFFDEMDPISAAIIASADEAVYLPAALPPSMKGLLWKMIGQNLGMIWHGLRALRKPELYRDRYLADIQAMEAELVALAAEAMPLRAFAESTMRAMTTHLDAFFATIVAAQLARAGMKRIFKDADPAAQEHLVHLERALPGNVTTEMGLAMYRLAQFDEVRACPSGEVFARRLAEGAGSPAFRAAWDALMERFGFRSPMEMDPAAPRYDEDPARFFEQLRTLASQADGASKTDEAQNPEAVFERARAQRERAYEALTQIAAQQGRRSARRFACLYHVWITLAGYRETPKYCMSKIADMFRKRLLKVGQSLVEAGRLDNLAQVFDLTIDDLDRALARGADEDLRALAYANTRYLARFSRVQAFPRVVDSRGKILRAPRKAAQDGELVGDPISPGVVRGPVKVLHTPDEKPVLPGDILVARATDPGWTPLFLNAGGIILEVGGMLQHGALVAREYGKPCVSGFERVTEMLMDGQMVEVDGTAGVIRWI